MHILLCHPLYRCGRYIYLLHTAHFLSHQFCICVFSSAGGQTRDVDPMSGYCWPTVYDAEQTVAQYWVAVSCLMPRWMWASVTDSGPTLPRFGSNHVSVSLTRKCVGVTCISPMPGRVCWPLTADSGPLSTQRAQSICVAFVQCWTNVENVGPTLQKCCTRVLCLLPWAGVSLTWPFHHRLN